MLRNALLLLLALTALPAGAQTLSLAPVPAPGMPEGNIPQILKAISQKRIEEDVATLAAFGTRSVFSSQTDPKRGIGAAENWILGKLRADIALSNDRLIVTTQTYTPAKGEAMPTPVPITSILAFLPGTAPNPLNRIIIVSGHYDSRCTDVTDGMSDAPGADDDGSGVAAMLEMVRSMGRYRFRIPILFCAFSGEEEGLYGSAYLADYAQKQDWNVEAMISNDIIGSPHGPNGENHPNEVRLFSEGVPTDETPRDALLLKLIGGENDGPSRQFARFVKTVAAQYVGGMQVDLIWRRDRFLRGSDHIPFLQKGYPAVRITEPVEDFRHQHQNVRIEKGVQYGDLLKYVDPAYCAQVARVNAAALAMLALAPDAPRHCGIVVSGLTNSTTLKWDASADPDIKGYYVVWRDTTAPLWTYKKWVGNVATATLDNLSKDNLQFGVYAEDQEGHYSPVSFPQPVQ